MRGQVRPIPTDFADICQTTGSTELAAMYHAGNCTIARWRRELGLPSKRIGGRQTRYAPDDFADYARIERNRQLSRRYGASVTMITRWHREVGIPGMHSGPKDRAPRKPRPAPLDFYQHRHLTSPQLQDKYGCGPKSIVRWRRETGATYARPIKPKKPKPFKRQPAPKGPPAWKGRPVVPLAPPRDTSIEGLAAEVLRQYAPVYRCDERGRYCDCEARRTHWRSGALVLTPDELFARAEGKGWRALL